MDSRKHLRRLKAMLAQTAPEGKIEAMLARGRPTATALESFSEAEAAAAADDAAHGLEKLALDRDDDVNDSELDALEAIVLPENRPVVYVRHAGYDDLPGQWTHLNGTEVRNRLNPLLRSIGRIELPNHTFLPYGGTGFVVGQNLLMTNRHVAKLFVEGLGLPPRLWYRSGDAAVDFQRFVSSPADAELLTVTEVEMIHPYWDMALLRVEGLAAAHAPLRLSVARPEDLFARDVIVVGYPARDDRNDLALQDQIFQRTYHVKRLQPGKLRERARIRSFETDVDACTHDSSTLGGNSGSAVIDVGTGQVIGLHFAGIYLQANYAVPCHELARDSRVLDAGLSFAGSVATTTRFDSAWQRALTIESSGNGAGSTAPRSHGSTATPSARQAPTARFSADAQTWTIPLHVSVAFGPATRAALAGAVVSAADVSEAPKMQVPIIFDGLEHRKGYDEGYLGVQGGVPLPQLTTVGKKVIAKLEDGSVELKYHKFSVVMHKGRRLALFTASNVDWRPSKRTVNGSKPTRRELTGLAEGTLEQWVTDWRISEDHQLPDVFFTKDGGAFDKGHLVRRDDVCWGSSFKDIQKGNGDTYHTTNCSPQTGAFNQASKGKDNWGDLETLVQKETKAEKASIFSGPVLADDDRLFQGKDGDGGKLMLRVPSRYWKIIVVKGAQGPEAFGFVLEQDLTNVPLLEEFAVPASWRKHTRSIADIEDMLNGLAQLPWLRQVDAFGSNEAARIAENLAG